jgi:hypothetical protein
MSHLLEIQSQQLATLSTGHVSPVVICYKLICATVVDSMLCASHCGRVAGK